MLIQVSSNNSIKTSEDLTSQIEAVVQSSLERYEEQLTRVEVHVMDENSHKGGENDKKCSMEARLEGRPPLAASHTAGDVMEAVSGCADKLQRMVDSEIERLRDATRR